MTSHSNSYFDSKSNLFTVRIKAGEYYATEKPEQISTVLGSCIAVCLRDPALGAGGMNHFMLPDGPGAQSSIGDGAIYGSFAMEQLINEILKLGGIKRRFEAKMFGGGNVIDSSSNVGGRNISFVRDFLANEKIDIAAEHVGGDTGRTIVYTPSDGKVLCRPLARVYTKTLESHEQTYAEKMDDSKQPAGDIELFS